MTRTSSLVAWSAIPCAVCGAVALSIAIGSVAAGRGDPIVWLAVGIVALAAAAGVLRGRRWAFAVEAILGLIVTIAVVVIVLFSLALTDAIGATLDGPMFGTPFGVLNGWASLALYGAVFVVGLWMLVASVSGLRTRTTI